MAPEQIAVARAFNTWLQAGLAERYGNVTVVDYLHWSSGGTGGCWATCADSRGSPSR